MKFKILSFLSNLIKWRLKRIGVELKQGTFFTGMPFVRMHHGSQIILHENVTIHSLKIGNRLCNNKATLLTTSPEAQIILHSKSGISGATLMASTKIEIGEGTLIGPDSLILDNDAHLPLGETDWSRTYGTTETGAPIIIGKGCFIGSRVIITKGVTIGDGAVVAAGAFVARDIPARAMAIGNPAQIVPLPPRFRRKRKAPRSVQAETSSE